MIRYVVKTLLRLSVLPAATLALLVAIGPASAATLSGQVTDERGVGIADVDLDFTVVSTGQDVNPSGDRTDANGNYSTIVLPEVYEVSYTPPPGSRFAGHVEENVDLNVNQTRNLVLRDAWFVSGQVLRADTGGPAAKVDLDFRDLSLGAKIFTPRDNTDVDGNYNVAVPIGIYEVSLTGPLKKLITDPSQLAPLLLAEEMSVEGTGDLLPPTATMALGFVVEGLLLDDRANVIVAADLDFLLAGTTDEIFTKNDNTKATGLYKTVVPPGTYDIQFNPPLASVQAAKIRPGVTITADANLGTDILNDGWAVSGFVRDPDANDLRRVDLDLTFTSDGTWVPAIRDDTDAAGNYMVRVLGGTYDILYRPLVNSLVGPTVRPAVGIFSDTVLPDTILPFHDEDGDGIADAHDSCPFRSGGFDLDLDGFGDLCDNCPSTVNPRQEDNDLDGTGNACDTDDDNDGISDISDGDMDGDGVDNGVDNCPQGWNPNQEDRDIDGDGNACDPDDGEVEYLEARSGTGFYWRPENGALGYQIYRQKLERLSSINYGKCFRDDLNANVFLDTAEPKPGEAFVYMVTVRTAAGEGSAGLSSSGAERPNLRSCP